MHNDSMNAKLAACILATPCSMTSFPGYILGGISCRLVVVWWQPILLPGQPALRSGHSQGAPSSILVGPQDPLPEDSSPTSNPRIQAPSYGHTSCPLPVQGAVKGSEPHASSIRSAFNCLSRQIYEFESDTLGTMIIFNTSTSKRRMISQRVTPPRTSAVAFTMFISSGSSYIIRHRTGISGMCRPFYPSELGSMGSGSTLIGLHP